MWLMKCRFGILEQLAEYHRLFLWEWVRQDQCQLISNNLMISSKHLLKIHLYTTKVTILMIKLKYLIRNFSLILKVSKSCANEFKKSEKRVSSGWNASTQQKDLQHSFHQTLAIVVTWINFFKIGHPCSGINK